MSRLNQLLFPRRVCWVVHVTAPASCWMDVGCCMFCGALCIGRSLALIGSLEAQKTNGFVPLPCASCIWPFLSGRALLLLGLCLRFGWSLVPVSLDTVRWAASSIAALCFVSPLWCCTVGAWLGFAEQGCSGEAWRKRLSGELLFPCRSIDWL